MDGLGSSRNAGNGSHMAVAPVTDAAGAHVGGSGSSEFTENGSHLAATGLSDEPEAVLWRRLDRDWRKCRQRCMAICPVKTAFPRTKTVFLSLLAGETRLCPDKSPMLRRANAHQLPLGRGHCLTKARCSLCRRGAQRVWFAVADKYLVMSRIMICPVGFCGSSSNCVHQSKALVKIG